MRIWDIVKGSQIGGLLQGHISSVFSVAYSPDGRRIASGSADKTVCIWDAERHVQIGRPLEGHDSLVFSVTFSPDGKKIVSGSADSTVRLWDIERGAQIGSPLEHTSAVNSVAFSLDGKRIISGSDDGTIRVWDVESFEDVVNGYRKLNLYSPKVYPICFSSVSSHALHDSEQLLVGLLQNSVIVDCSPVKLHSDGWIRGPMGRLLLWIHPTLWRPVYSMWTVLVIPIGCCLELDLSKMVHGSSWHECFRPANLSNR
ncbi:WD40-repeat-containing domain protein [Pisolithus sp. B1]|nr:WD40-repeat-containing domain protein [Pisolithus sp. B1]